MRLPARPLLYPAVTAALVAMGAAGLPTFADDGPSSATRVVKQAARAKTGSAVGFDTVGVRRGTTTFLRNSLAASGGATSYTEFKPGWYPVPGDLDGDDNDTVSYFYSGTWYLADRTNGSYRRVIFGQRGDRPVLGDWNGDGRDEMGVFRAGRWFIMTSANTWRTFRFGSPGDLPVAGDFDGNGRTDVAVRRGVTFYERHSTTTGKPDRTVRYGSAGDKPVVGDWDHDGHDQLGVFRNGTWYFRMAGGTTQAASFGSKGDAPFVRRVRSLASGVTHGVVRRYGSVAQITGVTLSAASTPDPVLARNSLGNLERTSSMSARTGAVVAINGDFAAASGRPVHAYGADGVLNQNQLNGGTGLGLSRGGSTARASLPRVTVTLTPQGLPARAVQRFNRGTPLGNELAVFSTGAERVERVPRGGCYAQLVPTGGRFTNANSGVQRQMQVRSVSCGEAVAIPAGGVLAVGTNSGTSGAFVRGLFPGQLVAMDQVLGYSGSVSLIGGSEQLVAGRQVVARNVDKAGAYAQGRHPRSAVGMTGDGRLVMVVVDGRRSGWSAGMTLRQIATLMRDLGAVEAINLDGGGSSTFLLSGLIINRPSDKRERAVSSALVVLRGADANQAHLLTGPLPSQPALGLPVVAPQVPPGGLTPLVPGLLPGIPGLSPPAARTVRSNLTGKPVTTTSDWVAAAQDPASTGGLAESEQLAGAPLDDSLALALQLLRGR